MFNALKYLIWLIGQIFLAGFNVIVAAFRPDAGFDPIIVRYPLRVEKDWQIAAFSTSITVTPSTLSLGLREPRQDGGPTVLLVQAVFGSDPVDVFESLADMESRMVPSVRGINHGVPGQGPDNVLRDGDVEYPHPRQSPGYSPDQESHESEEGREQP